MTKIAVLDDWQGVARESADWSQLEKRAHLTFFADAFDDEDDAATKLADFEMLLTMRERTPLPGSLVRALPRLRMIGITGPKNASLDLDACRDRNVTVSFTTSSPRGAAAPAELALGLLIAVARSIPAGHAAVRAGRFQHGVAPGIALAGKTLGIVGLGRLGLLMAGYGRALGMTVVAWSENLTDAAATEAGVERVTKDALLERSDAISLHLVLSPRSTNTIGAAEIARMKPGTILINTSRGPLVDEDALVAALDAKRIFAGLDVFDREPLRANDRLARVPNTVLAPHLGYAVVETFEQFYEQSIENALAYLDGNPIRVLEA